MTCRCFAASCLALVLAMNSQAAELLIDVNDRSGSQPTQTGYAGITLDGVFGLVTDIGTLDIEFAGTVGIALDDRDRGALDASQPISDLLRDFAFISENTTDDSGDGAMEITFTGLEAAPYVFVGYFHDRSVNHVAGDIAVSTDGGVTFADVVDNGLYSADTNPAVIGTTSFQFTANGLDPVVLRLTGQEGYFTLSGSFVDQNTALISGFELRQIPEPSSVAMLFLGVGAMLAIRRGA